MGSWKNAWAFREVQVRSWEVFMATTEQAYSFASEVLV